MTLINTRKDIIALDSKYPTGDNNECLTRSEIMSNSYSLEINADYSDAECPILEDVSLSTPLILYLVRTTYKGLYISTEDMDKIVQGAARYQVEINAELFPCNVEYDFSANRYVLTYDKFEQTIHASGGFVITFVYTGSKRTVPTGIEFNDLYPGKILDYSQAGALFTCLDPIYQGIIRKDGIEYDVGGGYIWSNPSVLEVFLLGTPFNFTIGTDRIIRLITK